jgi:cold shock CspA family protein
MTMDDKDTKQLKGTVEVWFERKGYCWVERDDKEADIFLHVSSLPSDYDFEPRRGDRVSFTNTPATANAIPWHAHWRICASTALRERKLLRYS